MGREVFVFSLLRGVEFGAVRVVGLVGGEIADMGVNAGFWSFWL